MGVEEDVDEERRWGMGGEDKENRSIINFPPTICIIWDPLPNLAVAGVSDLLKISET